MYFLDPIQYKYKGFNEVEGFICQNLDHIDLGVCRGSDDSNPVYGDKVYLRFFMMGALDENWKEIIRKENNKNFDKQIKFCKFGTV